MLSLPVTWLVYSPAWGSVSLLTEDPEEGCFVPAQSLNRPSQELYLGGSRANTNANTLDGNCPLELQTKTLLLNYFPEDTVEARLWRAAVPYKSHRYSKNTELLRSCSAPVCTLDVYSNLKNPHIFFTVQPRNRG